MKQPPKYLELIGDVGIPLLGFLLWDWGLYFILLFYFLDFVAEEVFMYRKSNQIHQHLRHKESTRWFLAGLSLAGLILVVAAVHGALYVMFPGIHFGKELEAFWTYTEMGIQQGYVLLPLVFLGAYQQYKMFFLMPARFRSMDQKMLWYPHLKRWLWCLGAALLAGIVAACVALPEWVYVIALLGGITVYTLLTPRFTKN